MSIKIDRFESYQLTRTPSDIKLHSKATVLIKDHLDDGVISFIQLNGDLEENKELARRIIETIEDYLESDSNETKPDDP